MSARFELLALTPTNPTYITPEDVGDALVGMKPEVVAMDVLAVLGKQTEYGAEDRSLCAFIAFRALRDKYAPSTTETTP